MFNKYIDMALSMGADHIVRFTTDQICFDSRTILKCMFGCSDYGYGHTCPSKPGSLKPWEYRKIFEEYKSGLIIHSTDKKISQQASLEIEKAAFLDGYHMAFSLADCALCDKCAGFSGVRCVHPKLARPAFHSVGIDVFRTVRGFDLPIGTLKDTTETQNWYSAVFID